MKPSEFTNSISVESYDEETAENYGNCYVAQKAHSFQTIKDIGSKILAPQAPNLYSTN